MAYSLNHLCRNVPQKQVQIEMIRDIVRNTFQLLFPNTGILRSTCKAAGATCKCKQHKHTLSHIFLLSYFFWCLVIIASILWVKFLKSQRSWCVNVGILFKCIPHLSVVRKLLKYKKKHLQLSFSNRSFWTGEEVWGSDSMFTQYNELFYHKVFDSSWHDPCHFGFFDRLERTQEIFRESDKKRELAHNKGNILTVIPHESLMFP